MSGNTDVVEIKIKVKGDEHVLTKKELYYNGSGQEPIFLSKDCIPLQEMAQAAKKEFPGEISEIVFKFEYIW